eukprot:COSAG05_NODE_2690_length_2768_cov_2.750468_1_plen_445_part_00
MGSCGVYPRCMMSPCLLLLLLAASAWRAHAQACYGPACTKFAKCDASKIEQQWCVTVQGQVRDHWGRCLSRHDSATANMPCTPAASAMGTEVFMDTCQVLCDGSQNWAFEGGKIAAKVAGKCIPDASSQKFKGLDDGKYCSCLDISAKNNAAQTYPCKLHDDAQGQGHCGDLNQKWKVNEDGTLQVAIAPTVMCPEWEKEDCKKPLTSNPCEPVCLVAPTPKAGSHAASNAGRGCVNTGLSPGSFLCLLFAAGAVLYVGGGMAVNYLNLRRGEGGSKGNNSLGSGEFRQLLPHRVFWAGVRALIMDGVAFTTGRSRAHRAVGGGGSEGRPSATAAAPLLLQRNKGESVADAPKQKGQKKAKGKKDRKKAGGKAAKGAGSPPDSRSSGGGKAGSSGAPELSPSESPAWAAGGTAAVEEQRDTHVHSSQAKVRVVIGSGGGHSASI